MKFLILTVACGVAVACSSGTCREKKDQRSYSEMTDTSSVIASSGTPNAASADSTVEASKVKVYKYDGSKQCGMTSKPISVQAMQKELKGVHVFSAQKISDGMMRIQLCGSPTGKANVYEIDKKDLEKAKTLGFQLWTYGGN